MKKSLRTLILLALFLTVTAVVTTVMAEAGPSSDNSGSLPLEGVAPSPILPIATSPPATPVVSLSIRLYADEEMTQVFADVVDGRVYLGCEACGPPALFFDGTGIYWGGNPNGEVLFCVNGERIVTGRGMSGPVAYTIRGRYIYEGESSAALLYTMDGDRLLAGDGETGQLILRADRRLEDSGARFLLPVLLELWSR